MEPTTLTQDLARRPLLPIQEKDQEKDRITVVDGYAGADAILQQDANVEQGQERA